MNNLGSTHIHNATYQVSKSSVIWFWRRRFFKVFTIYGHGGHIGHVTKPFEQLFIPPIPGGYIRNLVTIGPVVSEEKSFEIVDGRQSLPIL